MLFSSQFTLSAGSYCVYVQFKSKEKNEKALVLSYEGHNKIRGFVADNGLKSSKQYTAFDYISTVGEADYYSSLIKIDNDLTLDVGVEEWKGSGEINSVDFIPLNNASTVSSNLAKKAIKADKLLQENKDLELQNIKLLNSISSLKSTLSFQLGNYLVTTPKTPLGLIKIPLNVFRIYRDFKSSRLKSTPSQDKWFDIDLLPAKIYPLSGESNLQFDIDLKVGLGEKKNAALVQFQLDSIESSADLARKMGVSYSDKVGLYKYLNTASDSLNTIRLNVPESASEVKVSTLSWYPNGKIRARLIDSNESKDSESKTSSVKALAEKIAESNDWREEVLLAECTDIVRASALYTYSSCLAREKRIEVLNFLIDECPCSNVLAVNMRQLTDLGDFLLLNKALSKVSASDKLKFKKQVNSAIGYLNLNKRLPLIPKANSATSVSVNNQSPIAFVLHCSLPFHSNGYATRSHELIKAISKKENVEVYTRPGYPCDVIKGETEFTNNTVDGIQYNTLAGADYYLDPLDDYIKKSSEALIEKFIANPPKAVVAASSFYNAMPALIAAKSLGIPFIYEVRGLWEVTRASTISGWRDSDRFKLESELEAYVAKNADSVITITDGLRNELAKRGVEKSKISIVPNAISKEKFTFVKQKQKKIPVIGYVGSIVAYEGLDDLISALEIVSSKGVDFELVIAGDGSYLSELREVVRSSTIVDKVRILGRIPHAEVDSLLKTIDITPFPRKSIEVCELVSPLKPFEAMLSGKAIISSDVKALEEFIDGKNGLLFKKGDINDLSIKLEELLVSVELRKSLSEYAKEWVLKNRLWSVVTKQYSQVLNDIQKKIDYIENESVSSAKLNLLVYGDVDVNYTDGSSIWAVSTVDVLSRCQYSSVDFLLKADNLNSLVLEQINKINKDVKIIQPSDFGVNGRLDPEAAIKLICALVQKYDYDGVVLRGAEVNKLALNYPELSGLIWTYPIEIFQKDWEEVTLADKAILRDSAKILCQSDFIKHELVSEFKVDDSKIIDLPPMVPDSEKEYGLAINTKTKRIVYAGKFDKLWATEEMLEAFQLIRKRVKNVELHVYGNKFNDSSENKGFTKRIKELLGSKGVVWHKGVSREEVLADLPKYDLAWAWRSPELEMNTHEISTKFLEYSSKGLPILCVPGKVYVANLGEKYPLYVREESELVEKVVQALTNQGLLNQASDITYQSSAKYFYSSVVAHNLEPTIKSLVESRKEKSLLFAGHDLKFVRKYIELARKSGHKVVVDKWEGHNKHSILDSARKLSSANFIYCEWMLGNAVWYSENKLNHQKLITRFHRQELETEYPKQVNVNNIDEIHFIAPLVMRDARKLFWDDEAIGVLRENYIDSEALDKPKFTNAKYTLGLVGIVPKMKRIDKALDLLEELRRKDDRYTLRIKGKLPSDFDWMKSRKDEMRYYDKQFQRIEASEYLRGAVFFDGHGNDMDHWFRNIGYLLSFSDFEGCHLSAMEAMGSGAIPLISNWEGAGELYAKNYIFQNMADVEGFILKVCTGERFTTESETSKGLSAKWCLQEGFKTLEDSL